MKKNQSKIILAAVLVLILIVLGLAMCHKEEVPAGTEAPATESTTVEVTTEEVTTTGEATTEEATTEEETETEEVTEEETSPAETEPPVTTEASTAAPTMPETTEEVHNVVVDKPEKQLYLSDEKLSLDALGGYSGNYLEDGTDDLVNNIAAIVVTNHSDKMLQVADITFQVNASETAQFRITDLPSGATVLALELNRRTYSKEDDYSYGQTATGYMDTPTLSEDLFTIGADTAGRLSLTNKTDRAFEKVYVYYKYVQQGGSYLGGITYRVPFENLAAGGELTEIANHFDPANSRVVDLEIVKE